MESPQGTSSVLLKPTDYAVVATMLAVSSGIGIYYGMKQKRKQSTTSNYFLAGRKMTLIPMAFSAFATGMGPATVLGTPTESYNFGMQIAWWCVIQVLIAFILNWIFIPLYHKMGSMNVYKFLEVRYNRKTKNFVTTMAVIRAVLQCSNVVFGTSTAINRATNIDTWLIVGTITGICVCYTSLGGMKGVMWADVIQAVVMVLSFLTIIAMGLIHVGGVETVWKRSYESGRLDIFDFDTDPTARHTFWTSTVGYFFSYLASASTSQVVQQRYLTAPNIKAARRGSMLSISMTSAIVFLSQIIGLIIYAEYHSCDPLQSKAIQNMNQLVSAFVLKVIGSYPILPGIFFAGLLAAILSTMSSVYNSIPAIIMESLIEPLKPNLSPKNATIICKLLAVIVGFLNISCIMFTKNFPNVKQASVSIASIMDGSLLVLMLFGLFLPQANFKAAIIAFLSGISVSSWIVAGGLIVGSSPKTKCLSIEGCFASDAMLSASERSTFEMANNATGLDPVSPWAPYFPLHSISYLWITTIAVTISSTVFLTASLFFEKEEKRKDVVDVIPNGVQRFHRKLSKRWRKVFFCDVYDTEMQEKNDENMEVLLKN